MRRALASVVVLATLLAGGCSLAINWPKNDGDFACPPVQVVANWPKGDMDSGTFAAKLDGADVTSQFFVSNPNGRASAQLVMPPGSHVLTVSGDLKNWFSPGYSPSTATRAFTVPGSLSPSPNPLKVARNTTTPLAVGVTACSGPMTVTLSGLPFGVAANPSSFTVNNPQAAGSVSQPTTAGASGSTSIVTSSGAAAGNHTVTLQGTAPGVTLSRTFVIQVSPPTVSAVTPNPQARGGTITVSGGFDPTCGNNVVRIGGINVTPATCAPAGTSVSATVPAQAPFGATQVGVVANGLASNTVPFTVARQPGGFVPITAAVLQQLSSGRLCPGGSVRVDVNPGNVGANTASYRRVAGNVLIGSAAFDTHTPPTNVSPGFAIGGAGFSLCTHGIVVDAVVTTTSYAVRFLELEKTPPVSPASHTFPFFTATGRSMPPALWRSPDGTIIMIGHASTVADRMAVTFLDTQTLGQSFAKVEATTTWANDISAQITTTNRIVVTVSGTALSPITIP